MRKIHFKRILAFFLTAIMLLQDTQELLVYAADFASNVPRYVNFSAPDALEDVTDVIELEEEQEPLDEAEKDALVDEQTGTEQTETVTETEEGTETTEKEDTESTEGTETVEETEVDDTAVTTETEETTETEVVEETTESEEETETTEVIEETETVEKTETTEEEEIELREPELEEKEPQPGEIVSYTEDSITYALGGGQYQTVFGSNVGTYVDEEGNVQLEDNTLQEIATFSGDGVGVYTNTANDYQVVIPEAMSEDLGMLLEQDGYTLEVIPLGGDYTKSAVKENAILYNDVYENIDVQYTVKLLIPMMHVTEW